MFEFFIVTGYYVIITLQLKYLCDEIKIMSNTREKTPEDSDDVSPPKQSRDTDFQCKLYYNYLFTIFAQSLYIFIVIELKSYNFVSYN